MDILSTKILTMTSNAEELAASVSSYFQSKVSKLQEQLDCIVSSLIDGIESAIEGAYHYYNSDIVVIGASSKKFYSMLTTEFNRMLDFLAGRSDVVDDSWEISVANADGSVTSVYTEHVDSEWITSSMSDTIAISNGIQSLMSGFRMWATNNGESLFKLVDDQLQGIMSKTSPIYSSILSLVSKIEIANAGVVANPSGVLSSILISLGIVNDSRYDNVTSQIETYTGMNAYGIIFSNFISKIGNKIFDAVSLTISAIYQIALSVLGLLFKGVYSVTTWFMDVWNELTGGSDSLRQYNKYGDGTINVNCGVEMNWINNTDIGYTRYNTLVSRLYEIMKKNGSPQLSFPLFTGRLLVQSTGLGGDSIETFSPTISYRIRPINWRYVYSFAMSHEEFSVCAPFFGLTAERGRLSQSTEYTDFSRISRQTAANFISELSTEDGLFNLQHSNDSEMVNNILTSCYLMGLQLFVYATDGADDNTVMDSDMVSLMHHLTEYDISVEPGYVSKSDTIKYGELEPSNINMARLISRVSYDFFSNDLTYSFGKENNKIVYSTSTVKPGPDFFNDQPYIYYGFIQMIYLILSNVLEFDSTNESLTGVFIPYSNTLTNYSSGYYIPSDQNNVEILSGIYKKAVAMVAGVVITITAVALVSKAKSGLFRLQSQAEYLSREASDRMAKAAASGNSSEKGLALDMMMNAYRQNRKANLLGKICSSITTIPKFIGSTVTSISSNNVTAFDVLSTLKPM